MKNKDFTYLDNPDNFSNNKECNYSDKLFKWLDKDVKSYYSKIEVKTILKSYRGIFAKEFIPKDEIFLRVHLSKLITLEIAKESKIGLAMINKGISLKSPKHCFLACFLLLEKANNNSNFKEYINNLPKDYSNFPIFYKENESSLLEGSPFLSKLFVFN